MDKAERTIAPALKALGICAIIGAATTILNTMLPRFYGADGFDARMALIHNPFYAARQWVLLVHPAFILLLALGMALALWARAPGRALAGATFAFVEKMTEFWMGVTILFVVNAVWKVNYLAALGTPAAEAWRLKITNFAEVLDGLYFLLWAMFLLSTGLLAWAAARIGRFGRWVAATAGLAMALTLLMMLGEYGGQGAWTQPIIAWVYGPALATHRLLVGLWLLDEARRAAR
ncbi:MAG TPA: hypothetical protein VED40_14570 [Azospirillaceae bacterium]|nr:hypothetical protein [Azospirillaceae bacterium]